jgi:hypothetical protein
MHAGCIRNMGGGVTLAEAPTPTQQQQRRQSSGSSSSGSSSTQQQQQHPAAARAAAPSSSSSGGQQTPAHQQQHKRPPGCRFGKFRTMVVVQGGDPAAGDKIKLAREQSHASDKW